MLVDVVDDLHSRQPAVVNPPAFEQYLVGLFRRLGFTVKHVGARNDYGADLIVERNGSRVVAPFAANYDELLAQAQDRVRDSEE